MPIKIPNNRKKQLALNVLSNYLAVLWIGGLSLALIPWYTKLIGHSQWGILAVCMTLQSVMTLLDTGLSQIMPRDVARVMHDKAKLKKTYSLFSRAYAFFAVIGFAIGQIAAPWIAGYWLQTEEVQITEATTALRIVLLQFLFQFINNANTGYWNGMQEQSKTNLRQCFFVSVKHILALTLIITWRPSAISYLLSFFVISLFEFLINTCTIRRQFYDFSNQHLSFTDFVELASEIKLLAAGVIVGMLISQIDRILLSGVLDVTTFGRYVIVASLGLAFMQLQAPLVRAFLPKIASTDTRYVNDTLKQMGAAILLMCVLPCAVAAAVAPWMLDIWVGDALLVEQGTLPLRLILGAVALNGVYQIFYQKMLVDGLAKLILKINILILMIIAPFSVWVVNEYGIIGGGLTWMCVSALQLIFGCIFLNKLLK
jgi:O-antigen/teichoic acid export membrane protein